MSVEMWWRLLFALPICCTTGAAWAWLLSVLGFGRVLELAPSAIAATVATCFAYLLIKHRG